MSNYLFSDFFQGLKSLDVPTTPIEFSFQENPVVFTTSDLKDLKVKWDAASKSSYLVKGKQFICWDFEIPTFSACTMKQAGKELCYWGGGDRVIVHSHATCDCDDWEDSED